MSEFISGVITIIISFIMVLIMGYIFVLVFELDEHIKRLQKKIANAAEWKHKTGIDKEITEEEKEIAELERQKEKMNKLEELKRRKERLFSEVNPDCKWCGEDDCLQSAYTVDGVAQYYCTSCHKWLYDGSPMYR